jgi:hypothetical protein
VNKQILIITGASAASLAAGGTAGYFYAKKKIGAAFDDLLEKEIDSAKTFYEDKYFNKTLEQARQITDLEKTIDTLKEALVDYENSGDADIPDEEVKDAEDEEPELSAKDQAALAEAKEKSKTKARNALTDYGKMFDEKKPDLEGLVSKNIFEVDGEKVTKRQLFADAPRKDHPPLPPRDPGNGRFRAREALPDDAEPEKDDGDYAEEPYIITELQFVRGKENYEQESGKYYVVDDTVVDVTGEVIETDIAPVLYIRNDQTKMDYQITLVTESLTAATGFTDDGDPHSQYV